jgi:hypothetical protein
MYPGLRRCEVWYEVANVSGVGIDGARPTDTLVATYKGEQNRISRE